LPVDGRTVGLAPFGLRRSSAVLVDADGSDFEPASVRERVSGNVEGYPRVFGRPEQLAAWRENSPYVAEATA
jgi:hypothetical protein